MSGDLIRREEVLHAIGAEIVGVTLEGRQLLDMCQFVIKQLPSAEPERKHGEWLPHPHEREWDVCSVCETGCKRREFEMQFGQERFTEYSYQYCPYCGADMRGKHEN